MIYLIRLIFLSVAIPVLCLLLLPVFLIRPFHHHNGNIAASIWGPLAAWVCGLKVEVRGLEKLKNLPPSIIIGNHQHNLDLFFFSFLCPKGTLSIAKKSLGHVPFFGWAYALAGHLLIDRSNRENAMKTMKKMKGTLEKKNAYLMIMPEGTRSKTGEINRFKKGAFKTSMAMNWPIQPIVCSRYKDIIDLNKLSAGSLVFEILDPVDTSTWTDDNIEEKMEEVRQNMISVQRRLTEESVKLQKKIIKNSFYAFRHLPSSYNS